MAIYGEIKWAFMPDGSVKLDASHCTADGGAKEIEAVLKEMAKEMGGEWKEEKHILRNMHHHSHGNDHHQHH